MWEKHRVWEEQLLETRGKGAKGKGRGSSEAL